MRCELKKVLGKGVAVFVAAALSLVSLSGCSTDSNEAELADPWAAEFEQARASTDDPTLLKILADDKITDEEEAQAVQLEVDCVHEKLPGVEVTPHADGSGGLLIKDSTGLLPHEQVEKVMTDCSTVSASVTGLYNGIRLNPKLEDQGSVILDCLKRFHVVDDSMTLEQLQAVNPDSPPWDPLSGDAWGCITQMAGYTGGAADRPEPFTDFQGAFD
jgi:hypothetical protein